MLPRLSVVNPSHAAPSVPVVSGPVARHGAVAVATLTIVTDLNIHGAASEDSPDGAGWTATATGRVRFSLVRWVLAPRTTWQARRLATDFGEGMDARTAWAMARLARHPDERDYAMGHLDDDRRAADWTGQEAGPVTRGVRGPQGWAGIASRTDGRCSRR